MNRKLSLPAPARLSVSVLSVLSAALLGCGGASNGTGHSDLSLAQGDLAGQVGDMASPCYLPPGYSLVPFLSAEAQHNFPAAGMVLTPGKDYQAVIETDVGRIVLDLYETDTPITVNSFVFLALNHYFDGIAFHRVIDGFVAQTGDPNTLDPDRSQWGTGGPGYYFGLEIVNGLKYSSAGVVGMARTNQPNTNGSQFFITLAAASNLDGQYTIFAKVTDGLKVLPKIARGTQDMPPDMPTVMTQVCIVAK